MDEQHKVTSIERFYHRRNQGDERERAETLDLFCKAVTTFGRSLKDEESHGDARETFANEQFAANLILIEEEEKQIKQGRLTPKAVEEFERLKRERAFFMEFFSDSPSAQMNIDEV